VESKLIKLKATQQQFNDDITEFIIHWANDGIIQVEKYHNNVLICTLKYIQCLRVCMTTSYTTIYSETSETNVTREISQKNKTMFIL